MVDNGRAAINNIANNKSWFRDSPHRWASASLPLTYAIACVEVAAKSSEKAGAIYSHIVEAWGNPDAKAISKEILSELTDSKIEEIKQALIHPETAFLPDPNKPFRDIEEAFANFEINDESIVDKFAEIVPLIIEFIIVGFNRESDIARKKYRVFPSEKHIWLMLAIVMLTSFEHGKITERMRKFYTVRKYKGKTIDFHKVLTQEPMSRMHRRMVAGSKAAKLKLKNDRVFVDAAKNWYQCRVAYPSINKFCDAQSEKGIILDPKNVDKQIRPCDEAVGYQRRFQRKPSS